MLIKMILGLLNNEYQQKRFYLILSLLMAKDREKFLKRQDRRKRAMIATIIQDIISNDIDKYDCIAME